MDKCYLCLGTEELRPYGKDGQIICFDCGTSPENEEETKKRFNEHLQLISREAQLKGEHIVLTEDGIKSVSNEELEVLLKNENN